MLCRQGGNVSSWLAEGQGDCQCENSTSRQTATPGSSFSCRSVNGEDPASCGYLCFLLSWSWNHRELEIKVHCGTFSRKWWNPFLIACDMSLDFRRKTKQNKPKHLDITVCTLQEGQDLKHPGHYFFYFLFFYILPYFYFALVNF